MAAFDIVIVASRANALYQKCLDFFDLGKLRDTALFGRHCACDESSEGVGSLPRAD